MQCGGVPSNLEQQRQERGPLELGEVGHGRADPEELDGCGHKVHNLHLAVCDETQQQQQQQHDGVNSFLECALQSTR